MSEPPFSSPYPRESGLLNRSLGVWARVPMFVPIILFTVALFLPSYSSRWTDGRPGGVVQVGFQSLLSPPMGAAGILNVLAIPLWIAVLSLKRLPGMFLILMDLILGGFTGLVVLFFAMGDHTSDYRVSIGPGAWLWVLSILTTCLATPICVGLANRK